MKRLSSYSICMCAFALMLAPAATLGLPGQEASSQRQEKPNKEKDAFDKAGRATENAIEKAGEATGRGVGEAVEQTGRGVKTAAKATAGALQKSGEAIADFFDGNAGDEDRVREVQEALNRKGYDAGPVDGIAGPKTRASVSQFQRDEQLPETGKVDEKTAERLGVD